MDVFNKNFVPPLFNPRAILTPRSKKLAMRTISDSTQPRVVRAGVPTEELTWHKQNYLPIRRPHGTNGRRSPGTAFLFTVIPAQSNTLSTRAPSISCEKTKRITTQLGDKRKCGPGY